MFVQVRLLKGYQEPLWYKIPNEWSEIPALGSFVKVPLRNAHLSAVIEAHSAQKPAIAHEIKNVLALETFPQDTQYKLFINQLAHYYQLPHLFFFKRLRSFLAQKEEKTLETIHEKNSIPDITLTKEQQVVVDFVTPGLVQQQYLPVLVHGVTGSGKTEIYSRLIETALRNNRSVFLLLPEVSLAVQFTHLLQARFGTPVFGFHSASSIKEKKSMWQQLCKQQPCIVIGVHLPILLPCTNLGLLIIDEEHDIGYQEKKFPRINTKEAALLRAQQSNIPIVLGSATPSLSSLHQVQQKKWHFFQITQRFAGAFPTIKKVLLSDKKKRKNFWISNELYDAITQRLEKKEQTILFLNRRGHSFFLQCKACSFIFRCHQCSVSLTYHENGTLVCHYCGFNQQEPSQCNECNASSQTFLKKGIGTQQLVTIVKSLFPHATVARADMDTTVNKKVWQQTVTDFTAGAIDILIGTQTITKGYHFPHVTLVGIIWADSNIHFPMYNASEVALQQLIQVAGRAGRQHKESLVIVQSMADHALFAFLDEQNYLQFYQKEFSSRTMVGYPPCMRLAHLEIKGTDELTVEQEAQAIATQLMTHIVTHSLDIKLLGPAKPLVHQIKKTFSRSLFVKSNSMRSLIELYQLLDHTHYQSFISFTPNPMT